MYYGEDGSIHIEKTDQCYSCKFFNSSQSMCPLLEALVIGAVEFEEELSVDNCSWYTEKSRHLKVIKNSKNEET